MGRGLPQSLTPPLPQPPIRPRGSPRCGHFMPVCEVMTKLEPAMFYSQFRAHCEATSGSAQPLHTQRGPEESESCLHALSPLVRGFWHFYLFPFTVPACLGTCGKSTGFTTIHIVPEHWQAERKQD